MSIWNPWHGCTRLSRGCAGCTVFRVDAAHGRNTTFVRKTQNFDLPLRRGRRKEYRLVPEDGIVETCCTSDFFHPDADPWRPEAWAMVKERQDLTFLIITKRPERFYIGLPDDWENGYGNVILGCSCESQYTADRRLPVFLKLPVQNKRIILEPMLQRINLEKYLEKYHAGIDMVVYGGETGDGARPLDYAWVIEMNIQCVKYGVPFRFFRTGTNFIRGGRKYTIGKQEQADQAARACIDYSGNLEGRIPAERGIIYADSSCHSQLYQNQCLP